MNICIVACNDVENCEKRQKKSNSALRRKVRLTTDAIE